MKCGILIALLVSGVALGGCGTFESINPFSNEKNRARKEQSRIDRYDDLPLTKSTGSIPSDDSNAVYTEESLEAAK